MKFKLCHQGIYRALCLVLCLGLLLGFLVRPRPALAQGSADPSGYWRYWNTANSDLPSNTIQALAYSEDLLVDVAIPGLWIGTDQGLRYTNGRDWEPYPAAKSDLPHDNISAILEVPRSNELWIGTLAGVAHLDYAGTPRQQEDDTWQAFTTADGLPGDEVRCLARGPGDIVWAGTSAGLARYDGTTWRPYTEGLPGREIRDLAYDAGRGGLWVATEGGVGRLNLETETWTIFHSGDSELPDDDVRALAVDEEERVWLGTAGGLAVLFPNDTWQTWVPGKPGLPNYPVSDLSFDPSGRYLWVATAGGGASRYDVPADHWDRLNTLGSGLPDDRVGVVLAAHENTVWLGTTMGLSGVERAWETYSFLAPRVPGSLASNEVLAGWVDPQTGTVWVGTEAGGLSRSDDGGQTWQTFSTRHGLGGDSIYAL